MQRDGFRCRACGDDNRTLNVDHRIYRKGCDPWEYEDTDLWTLCEDCHGDITGLRQELFEIIGRLDFFDLETVKRVLQKIPSYNEALVFSHGEITILQESDLDAVVVHAKNHMQVCGYKLTDN